MDLLINDERVDSRIFGLGGQALTWHVGLPAEVRADGLVDVAFVIEEPRSPLAVGWSTDDTDRSAS